MGQKSRIESELPDDKLKEFNRLLGTGRFTIDALTTWLEGEGFEISRSSVGRYASHFKAVAERIKQSREMTQALSKELGEAGIQGEQGRLLVEMARSLVFDFMSRQGEDANFEPKDFAMLGKGLAEMARANRYDQDFEEKVNTLAEKIADQKVTEALETVVAERGLTEEQAGFVRAKILGVKVRKEDE